MAGLGVREMNSGSLARTSAFLLSSKQAGSRLAIGFRSSTKKRKSIARRPPPTFQWQMF
jgi:hypothetical protein